MLASAAPQLTVAREHAALGEYEDAAVYYDGVLTTLERCARRDRRGGHGEILALTNPPPQSGVKQNVPLG